MALTRGFAAAPDNSFYYLCGIETPHAYLRLDGRTRKATLYLPPRNERLERSEGKVLSAADAELVKRLTGADDVHSTEAMGASWPLGDGSAGRDLRRVRPGRRLRPEPRRAAVPPTPRSPTTSGTAASRASAASSSCCARATRAPRSKT